MKILVLLSLSAVFGACEESPPPPQDVVDASEPMPVPQTVVVHDNSTPPWWWWLSSSPAPSTTYVHHTTVVMPGASARAATPATVLKVKVSSSAPAAPVMKSAPPSPRFSPSTTRAPSGSPVGFRSFSPSGGRGRR